MTKIKIDKNIPIPEKKLPTKYPWREMEVGDSFAVPCEKEGSIAVCKWKAGDKEGRKFTYRNLVEDGQKVIRVWRIA